MRVTRTGKDKNGLFWFNPRRYTPICLDYLKTQAWKYEVQILWVHKVTPYQHIVNHVFTLTHIWFLIIEFMLVSNFIRLCFIVYRDCALLLTEFFTTPGLFSQPTKKSDSQQHCYVNSPFYFDWVPEREEY